jgi:hypothetical protein
VLEVQDGYVEGYKVLPIIFPALKVRAIFAQKAQLRLGSDMLARLPLSNLLLMVDRFCAIEPDGDAAAVEASAAIAAVCVRTMEAQFVSGKTSLSPDVPMNALIRYSCDKGKKLTHQDPRAQVPFF